MTCVACRTGRKWECEFNGKCSSNGSFDSINDDGSNVVSNALQEGISTGISGRDSSSEEESDSREGSYQVGKAVRVIETYKDDSVLRDQQSTGRKRAAQMYPLFPEEPCEWQKKKNCGGGNKPITGCVSGLQQARHHGPDKNTLNNDEGNVHRICHNCHNRWHTENDEGYVWGSIYKEHSPVAAELGEILQNELYWSKRSVVKAKD